MSRFSVTTMVQSRSSCDRTPISMTCPPCSVLAHFLSLAPGTPQPPAFPPTFPEGLSPHPPNAGALSGSPAHSPSSSLTHLLGISSSRVALNNIFMSKTPSLGVSDLQRLTLNCLTAISFSSLKTSQTPLELSQTVPHAAPGLWSRAPSALLVPSCSQQTECSGLRQVPPYMIFYSLTSALTTLSEATPLQPRGLCSPRALCTCCPSPQQQLPLPGSSLLNGGPLPQPGLPTRFPPPLYNACHPTRLYMFYLFMYIL